MNTNRNELQKVTKRIERCKTIKEDKDEKGIHKLVRNI